MPDKRILGIRARELRKEQTPAEQRLWHGLRQRRVGGIKFRRQVPIDRFIADFCCTRSKLIVEVDGSVHDSEKQQSYDQERTAVLEAAGYRVIRFTNAQVEQSLAQVLYTIFQACQQTKRE